MCLDSKLERILFHNVLSPRHLPKTPVQVKRTILWMTSTGRSSTASAKVFGGAGNFGSDFKSGFGFELDLEFEFAPDLDCESSFESDNFEVSSGDLRGGFDFFRELGGNNRFDDSAGDILDRLRISIDVILSESMELSIN